MKPNDMINQIKTLLGVEVKMAEAKLENGTIISSESFSAGDEIFIVTEDEKVAMPIGTYTLDDQREIVVEEEGVIASIGEPTEEEVEAPEEVEASEEVKEEILEEEKEEMAYATKEELAEVKDMIEEIKAMIEKEEMSASEDKEVETTEEVKEELAAVEPVEKVTHNPETETKKSQFLYSQKRTTNTLDRVMAKISNINK